MTELLITLMNAPRIAQRSVALGILVIFLSMAGAVVTGLLSILASKVGHIEELRTELYRFEQVIARKPQATSSAPLPAPREQLFIEGVSTSAIQAALQDRLSSAAAASGVTIASMSGNPATQINGATYVGLRADFDGDLQSVHEVIRQLETSSPPLIIRRALIRSNNNYSQGALHEPIHLSAQIFVYGAASPEVTSAGGTP